jgi:hypothetical protein
MPGRIPFIDYTVPPGGTSIEAFEAITPMRRSLHFSSNAIGRDALSALICYFGVGRGCGVGRGLGVTRGVGVAVGVGVGVGLGCPAPGNG